MIAFLEGENKQYLAFQGTSPGSNDQKVCRMKNRETKSYAI